MRRRSITLMAFALAATACTSAATVQPDPPPAGAPPVEAPPAGAPPAGAPPVEGQAAFIVSFTSPGDGTDHAASDRLNAIVAATDPKPARESRSWGREGEHDECFLLTGLSPAQRAAFIDRVTREVGSSDRVDIRRGETCGEAP